MHTKVTLGEHDTKSMHLCLITTWHTTQIHTFKIYWEQKYSYMWSGFFCVTPHLNYFLLCLVTTNWNSIVFFFIKKRNIRCTFNFIFWRIEVVRYWEVKLHWIQQFGLKKLPGIRNREDPVFRVFYHIKNRRENSGPTKSSGFMGIPVLRGSDLESFYCTF